MPQTFPKSANTNGPDCGDAGSRQSERADHGGQDEGFTHLKTLSLEHVTVRGALSAHGANLLSSAGHHLGSPTRVTV
jgi:hypothetical protein